MTAEDRQRALALKAIAQDVVDGADIPDDVDIIVVVVDHGRGDAGYFGTLDRGDTSQVLKELLNQQVN